MPTLDAVPQRVPRARATEKARAVSPGAVVLAAALPILFLHVDWQPKTSVGLGATLKLQDALALATLAAAAVVALRAGVGPLRAARAVWIPLGLLLAWIVAACLFPRLYAQPYHTRTHLVTAGEYVEYALLAPAVPLLLRRRADWLLCGVVLLGWSVAATVVGIAQWAGWGILEAWPQGRRQPSFVGTHDFGALSGLVLGAGLVALAWRVQGRERTLAVVAVVSGAVGFVLSGSSAGIVGLVPAALVALGIAFRRGTLSRRTAAVTAATVAIASLGVLALRANDFHQFFRFLGAQSAPSRSQSRNVQTYSQRTLLADLGLRIWERHPLLGAGWQASTEDAVVARELPALHRRFPTLAEQGFPGPGHEYGVQLLYVQALSDLGVVGLLLLLACLLAAVVLGIRVGLDAPAAPAFVAAVGVFWIVLAAGLFTAIGFVAGLPTDALLWLGLGAVAAAAAARGRVGAGA